MEHVNLSFKEKLAINPWDKRLFIEIPEELEALMLKSIESNGIVYINDPLKEANRVITQSFTKVYHDFKTVRYLIGLGYQAQAATICSSMHETCYFIRYVSTHPHKAQEWLNHDEYKWSENFNNWLVSFLSDSVKKQELTEEERAETERMERETYSILCASKHSNGFALRKTNVIMKIEGKPQLVVEPGYTAFSRGECAGTMGTSIRIASQATSFYLSAISKGRTTRTILQNLTAEALVLGRAIMEEANRHASTPNDATSSSKSTDLFAKAFKGQMSLGLSSSQS